MRSTLVLTAQSPCQSRSGAVVRPQSLQEREVTRWVQRARRDRVAPGLPPDWRNANVMRSAEPRDAELVHPRFKSGPLEPEDSRGSPLAADAPSHALEHGQD